MTFLAFDALLWEGKNPSNSTCIPLGYSEFATIFNTGASHRDARWLFTFAFTPTRNQITRSSTPVFLDDFHITPEQCGLAPLCQNGITEAHAFILEDYATMQAYKNKRCRDTFQDRDNRHWDRDDKCCSLFARPGSTGRRPRRSAGSPLITDTEDHLAFDTLNTPAQASTSARPATNIPTTASELIINEHTAEYPASEPFTSISADTYSDLTRGSGTRRVHSWWRRHAWLTPCR